MNIQTDREKMIFKRITDKGTFYTMGLSKKDKDGNYIKGYISCRFPKEAVIEDKTKIKIHEAWLDFYTKDKVTYPYIFINKYEIVQPEQKEIPMNYKTDYKPKEESVIVEDKDLPF